MCDVIDDRPIFFKANFFRPMVSQNKADFESRYDENEVVVKTRNLIKKIVEDCFVFVLVFFAKIWRAIFLKKEVWKESKTRDVIRSIVWPTKKG